MAIELLSDRSPTKRSSDFCTIAQAEQIARSLCQSLADAIVKAMEGELTAMACANATLVSANNALLQRIEGLERLAIEDGRLAAPTAPTAPAAPSAP